MASHESDYLHIWLIAETGSNLPLFADICSIVRRLVERSGGTLEDVPEPVEMAPGGYHFFAKVRGLDATRCLSDELGIHRAQVVPKANTSGRVETTLVGVELIASGSAARADRPEGPILKTYNYIHRRVTHHASGRQVALDSVLRGES
jgi:protein subunit release factor A